MISATLEVCEENGDLVVGSDLDVSDKTLTSSSGTWSQTFYPVATTRGVFWLLSTWTTSLGLFHKRMARLTVV